MGRDLRGRFKPAQHTYKAVLYVARVFAAGRVLQAFYKPARDLNRGRRIQAFANKVTIPAIPAREEQTR